MNMVNIAFKLTFLSILLLWVLYSKAWAASWVSSDGVISVHIPTDWELFPLSSFDGNSNSKPVLLAGPKGTVGSRTSQNCGIFKLDHASSYKVTQPMANSVLEKWDQYYIVNEARKMGMPITNFLSFSNEIVDNVQVVKSSFNILSNGISWKARQAQFMLATGDKNASFYTFSCFEPEGTENSTVGPIFSSLMFSLPIP